MRLLTIGNKQVMLDDEDYDRVAAYHWREAVKAPGYFMRAFSYGYTNGKQNRRYVFLHRFILGVNNKTIEVDHKNNDPLDNRRSNLRQVTHQQNMWNRRKQRNNRSGHIGVHWNKERRKWRAVVRFNDREHSIGYFDNLTEAVQARDAKALELHGEFAKLNILTT